MYIFCGWFLLDSTAFLLDLLTTGTAGRPGGAQTKKTTGDTHLCFKEYGLSFVVVFICSNLPRTVQSWRNSLVVKRVFFECFDCFLPLFYIAFYQLDVVTLQAEIFGLFMCKLP